MIEGIKAFKERLNEVLDVVVKQAGMKCQKNAVQDDAIIKKYDPAVVQQLAKQYVTNQDYQSNNAAEIRNRLVAGLGEDGERTFANLYATTDYDTAINAILDVCTKNAREAMKDTANSDPLMKMVGVNILDKLKNELNTEEKLERFVKQTISWAKSYVQFNPVEAAKQISGQGGQVMHMVQVSLPVAENDSQQAFCNKLIKAYQQNAADFNINEDVSVNSFKNQMVVVCAVAGFPLRYLANLTVLKDKYDRLLAAPSKELNRMVLHTESFKKELPPLFELETASIAQMAKKPLLLAFAMKLIQPQSDPTTGEKFFAMNIPDEFDDNWVKLAKDFKSCLGVLAQDYKRFKMLEAQVEKELRTQARSNDQKAALRKELAGVVQQVILPTMCEGNQFDPVYAEYKNLAKAIFNEELKDL